MDAEARAKRAKERYSAKLLREPAVSSVGIKRTPDGEYALVIGLEKKSRSAEADLRKKIHMPGVRLVFETVGAFRKF